jgi:hypothetical protein
VDQQRLLAAIIDARPGPADVPDRQQAVFKDLLEEMESTAGGSDRCRWPLDEPYGESTLRDHRHWGH